MDDYDLYRIDGHTLRIFVSVCQTKSVSRTAELFDLNQSTISHTIEKMRAAVGDHLFIKSGRGIMPTEKSLLLVPRAQKILADIEGLVAPEEYDASQDRRPFTVAISTPALLRDVKILHTKLLAASDNIRLELRRLAPRNRVVQMLDQEDADLAVAVSGYRYPSILNHSPYGSDRLVVFFDPKFRDGVHTIEDYLSAKHGAVSFGGGMRSVVETALSETGRQRTISLVSPTTSMLGDLLVGTDIIATMPVRLAESIFSNLSYCPPPIEMPDIHYDLVWHRKYEFSGRNLWLREKMNEVAATLYGRPEN